MSKIEFVNLQNILNLIDESARIAGYIVKPDLLYCFYVYKVYNYKKQEWIGTRMRDN